MWRGAEACISHPPGSGPRWRRGCWLEETDQEHRVQLAFQHLREFPAHGHPPRERRRLPVLEGSLACTQPLAAPSFALNSSCPAFDDFGFAATFRWRAIVSKEPWGRLQFFMWTLLIMTKIVHFSLGLCYVRRDNFHQSSELTFASAIPWFFCSQANVTFFSEFIETLPINSSSTLFKQNNSL